MTITDLFLLLALVIDIVLALHIAEMHGDISRLRTEVRKCLRILYDAVEADPEGGDADA